ncbi:MAG: hypothetical protein ACRYFU_27010 [Janthinobacterium lividum]
MFLLMAALLLAGDRPSAAPNALLQRETAIARQFESRVHIETLPFRPRLPRIQIETRPSLSYFDGHTIREARFKELPPEVQAIFNAWAADTSDQPSGEQLFADMFYKFFFVHELGHWVAGQVIMNRHDANQQAALDNMKQNHWQTELECNRISVAWWREHDPNYLPKLMADFRAIEDKLPNPVPEGQSKQAYFAANYERLGNDPQVYGWFLLQSALDAYGEPPVSFQQVLDELPGATFR